MQSTALPAEPAPDKVTPVLIRQASHGRRL
jgi:hypothetical protein